MKTATIERSESSYEGTFGTLTVDDGWSCNTGELPWKDNEHLVSCIPEGSYVCKWIVSPKHGPCYEVTGVLGRSNIEIHSANFCGDANCGMKHQLLGCIALGYEIGSLDGQKAVLKSISAVCEFNSHMAEEDFSLVIKNSSV